MNIKVGQDFSGSLRFRLTFNLPVIGHCCEYVRGEQWDKKVASEALDMLQHVYGISRKNVRFMHR
jgi:hypothetical protein